MATSWYEQYPLGQAHLHRLIARLDENDADLRRVALRAYNWQLADALQRTKITLELEINVSALVFNDASEEHHFTTYLSTVFTLKEVIFCGGISVVSHTLSPERVLRLVEAVWSNPYIGRLKIAFRAPFQLGGLFRTPSSIPNMELHLYDFDRRADQDEFVNGAAQNNSWHSLKIIGDDDGIAMMQHMLDEGLSSLTHLTELEISTVSGVSFESALASTPSIQRISINCDSSFDNEGDWSASIWPGLQVNQTIRELIFSSCAFNATGTQSCMECIPHHRKEFMRRVGILHCTFHGMTGGQVAVTLFTSQLGTSLEPAEVQFAPHHPRDTIGNVLQAISTAATSKVNLGVLQLWTNIIQHVQDVCDHLPAIGHIRHLAFHCINPPRAHERDVLYRLLVALQANGSLVTFDLSKWADIVDERYLRTFRALLERNERVPEMVGRLQTRDDAPLRPQLFQVTTATPRVTPNTFLRGLLSLDQDVAATTAKATATIPTLANQMVGTKRSGSEMDETTGTETAKKSRKL